MKLISYRSYYGKLTSFSSFFASSAEIDEGVFSLSFFFGVDFFIVSNAWSRYTVHRENWMAIKGLISIWHPILCLNTCKCYNLSKNIYASDNYLAAYKITACDHVRYQQDGDLDMTAPS